MKMKNKELSNINEALIEFALIPMEDANNAYASMRSLKKVESALKNYEKSRIKICLELAMKDREGNAVTKEETVDGVKGNRYAFETPEIEQEVKNRVNELAEKEVEIEFYKIPLYKILKIKNLSGSLIYRLGEFIDETQTEEPKIMQIH